MSQQDQGETSGKVTAVERIEQNIIIGTPIFEKIFSLDSSALKKVIREIFETFGAMTGEDELNNFLNGCDVRKEIFNDKASSIEMAYYDKVIINQLGITLQSEHGNEISVVKFNKYFKLNLFD